MGSREWYHCYLISLLMIDPSPPAKIKKRWDPFDGNDPNLEINLDREQFGLPPIDFWNIGVEYTYKRLPTPVSALLTVLGQDLS